ncbi:MAG TPA: sigma 54-interacting transcriptional regulator [Terriglobales bacterium]|nr:sigma 54-interacting transcriptional regulator [Terriglobales bacterium]
MPLQAKLIGIAGPVWNQTFTVDTEASLGRDAENTIAIADPQISRRHCKIQRDNQDFVLLDLNSHNGTLVNGARTQRCILQNGDQISVGPCVFVAAIGEVDSTHSLPEEFGPKLRVPSAEVEMDETSALQPSTIAAVRTSRELGALVKIASRINAIRDLESLEWQLLGMIFDLVPADRGAILLLSGIEGEYESVVAWNKMLGPAEPVHVSRTIAQQVIRNHAPVLANKILNGEYSKVTSLAERQVVSVMCVPLMVGERVMGLIYLDSSHPAAGFDDGHLELLSAIAGVAALAIESLRRIETLETENQQLRELADLEHNMIGDSPRMQEVYRAISKVAGTDSSVLISGESGTGKELAARAIHRNSPRADEPFVAINCAALTETLLESELFGYEKGAFTGAVAQKKGLMEAAHDGTVFLDEISEMALGLQAKLLRVLQERELTRVGGTKPIKVNVRLIAASNCDLAVAVAAGKFRQDLFYRIKVITINMPALRQRQEDLPLLADHFRKLYAERCKRQVQGISREAIEALARYSWPGNVRELQNVIERAVVLGSTPMILAEDLPEELLENAPATSGTPCGLGYHESVTRLKKDLILKAVDKAGGNFTEAARLLGLHPNYLHRLIRNLELRPLLEKMEEREAGAMPRPGDQLRTGGAQQ